jgi:hypothetical protein
LELRSKRTLTAIVIVAIVVIAVVSYMEYQDYNSPTAKCDRNAAQGDSQVGFIFVNPTITVAQGASTGSLSVTLGGSTCAPISGFVITAVYPLLSGVVNASFIEYQGALISPAHPEPVSEPASGSVSLSNVSATQSYTLTYKITLATNGPEFSSQQGNITVSP